MATVVEKPERQQRSADWRPDKPKTPSVADRSDQAKTEPLEQLSATTSQKIVMAIAVVFPFLGFVAAIVLAWQFGWMSWFYLAMVVGGWIITGLGITIGFHRLLSHRAFDTYNWVRAGFAGLGSMAAEGQPLAWCAVHRMHHQHSDKEGDPHSPHLHGAGWRNAIRGFIHAHTGWLFETRWSDERLNRYVPDLVRIPALMTIGANYLWFIVASLAIPAIIGGLVTMSWLGVLLGFLWGGLARIFLTHHVTWSINSICHIFGSQDFEAGDDSRNNPIFGILSHGEGWHNNHHAFPTSARHGLKWWQFDLSWLVIQLMRSVGLAWNVRTPSKRSMQAKRIN